MLHVIDDDDVESATLRQVTYNAVRVVHRLTARPMHWLAGIVLLASDPRVIFPQNSRQG